MVDRMHPTEHVTIIDPRFLKLKPGAQLELRPMQGYEEIVGANWQAVLLEICSNHLSVELSNGNYMVIKPTDVAHIITRE